MLTSGTRLSRVQPKLLAAFINSVPCIFTYQHSIKDSVELLKEGNAKMIQGLKRRWPMATAEIDDGELSVLIPQGMIVPTLVCACDMDSAESRLVTAKAVTDRSYCRCLYLILGSRRTKTECLATATPREATEFFMHEIGSYPFSTFKLVFVEDAWATTFTSATMAVCSTALLHSEDVIDQVYETRKVLTRALAQQWFGLHIVPKSWPDIWVIVGLANFVSSLFLKKLFGTNEYRFRMKKDIERCCATDKDRPPLYNPNIAYPIDQDDLEFIGLKVDFERLRADCK
ncbi:hypothetical protein BGX28_005192 [Mortierella sp. GBA30]|nr:hypothetical protein BGX28_005192 [Mortierella sp. GBA30]